MSGSGGPIYDGGGRGGGRVAAVVDQRLWVSVKNGQTDPVPVVDGLGLVGRPRLYTTEISLTASQTKVLRIKASDEMLMQISAESIGAAKIELHETPFFTAVGPYENGRFQDRNPRPVTQQPFFDPAATFTTSLRTLIHGICSRSSDLGVWSLKGEYAVKVTDLSVAANRVVIKVVYVDG